MKFFMRSGYLQTALTLLLVSIAGTAFTQPIEPVLSLAKKEKPALLESLKTFVSIETGSRDFDGLTKLADLIAARLKSQNKMPTGQ